MAKTIFDVSGVATPSAAIAATGVSINSPSGLSQYMLCSSVEAELSKFDLYEVTATYENCPVGFFPNPLAPLQDPPKYKWECGNTSEAVDRDPTGNPITNSAGDAWSNPPTRNFSVLCLRVIKNQPQYNPSMALQFQDNVNSAAVIFNNQWIFNPGVMLCKSIQPAQ